MKQISGVLLSFFICLLLSGCSESPPPLEITKVWIVEKFEFDEPLGIVLSTPKAEENFQPLTLTYSKDFNYSVELPQSKPAHRFIAVEITPKSEAEFKFKPEEAILTDSAGNRYLPVGFAPFSNMKYLHYFKGFNAGTLKAESPAGGIAGVGRETKDAPTLFSFSGKRPKGALIYEVPAEGGSFQLNFSDFSPLDVKVE